MNRTFFVSGFFGFHGRLKTGQHGIRGKAFSSTPTPLADASLKHRTCVITLRVTSCPCRGWKIYPEKHQGPQVSGPPVEQLVHAGIILRRVQDKAKAALAVGHVSDSTGNYRYHRVYPHAVAQKTEISFRETTIGKALYKMKKSSKQRGWCKSGKRKWRKPNTDLSKVSRALWA